MYRSFLLLITAPLLAQDATELDQTKPPPFLQQSITVTATRGQLDTEQAPVSVSSVTAGDITARRLQLLDQALNTSPGLFVFRGKGAQDTNAGVGMRGFSGRGSGQSRVLVLVDGQPVNDSYTGQVNWTTLPIEEVERVEVVRGSFSSLYGGNAMGGVVNVLTKPVTRRQAEIYGGVGNQASTRYGARVADRFFERLGVGLAYDRMQSGGYPSQYVANAGSAGAGGTRVTGAVPSLTASGGQTFLLGRSGDNWWNQHSVRARGDYAFGRRTVAYVQFQRQWSGYGYDQYETYLRTAAGAPFDSGTATIDWNGASRRFTLTPSTFLQGDGRVTYWLFSGRLSHEFAGGGQLQLGGGRSRSPRNYYSTPATTGTTISDRPYGSWFGTLQYARKAAVRHTLTAGTELRQDESQLVETPSTTGVTRGQALNQGTYVQDQWKVRERLSLTTGARYDYWKTYDGDDGARHWASRTNNSLSAKAAALWRAPLGIAVRTSVGNAFRSPSVYDLYRTWRSSTGVTYAANPDLRPERLISFEAGARRRWSKGFEVDGAFFQNRTSNLIYRTTDFNVDRAGNYRPVVNAARGRTNGIELSARLPLHRWLYAVSSYTWNAAKISENPAVPDTVGKRVPFVPAHTTGGSLYSAFGRVSLSTTARYVSPMFSADLNTDTTKGVYGAYDPFFTLDAGASFAIARRMSLEASGENLLNRVYYSYYPCPGRLVSVRLRIRL